VESLSQEHPLLALDYGTAAKRWLGVINLDE
jgi:hypothetical protein